MLRKSEPLSVVVSGDLAIDFERSGRIAGYPRVSWVAISYTRACMYTRGGRVR